MTMLDYLIVKVSDFMDKQQKELSKRFGNTHWLSSPKHETDATAQYCGIS